MYPHKKPTSKPCKCGLYHPEEKCKTRQGSGPQFGKIVRN